MTLTDRRKLKHLAFAAYK